MTLREAAVDSPESRRLLADYFAWREASFPSASGPYTVTFPEPDAFRAPRGVFLLAFSPDDDPDSPRDDPERENDGKAIGCGGIRRIADDDRGRVRYEVKHVWLAPQSRGRGLATTLMIELETRARRFGADAVVLDTHDSLEGAAKLYARLGYRRVDAYNDNPNATVWYAKDLTGDQGSNG
jgi:ribosomal protein S18 acetylase RimI-like enzyme